MQNFRRKLKRSNKKLHPQYFYAIEKSSNKEDIENGYDHEHIHILLLLNGSKTRSIVKHWENLQEIWYKQLDFDYELNKGLVQLPKRGDGEFYNGTMLERNSAAFLEEFIDVFSFSSYLLKDEQKDGVPYKKE